MSQSQSQGLPGVSYKATADLSAKQYYAVIADTANATQVVIATANAMVLGFLQNKPKAAEIAQIQGTRGATTKAVAGAATAKGDKLVVDSSGRVITATTGAQLVCGVGMEASTAAGDIIEVFLLDSYIA